MRERELNSFLMIMCLDARNLWKKCVVCTYSIIILMHFAKGNIKYENLCISHGEQVNKTKRDYQIL